MNKLVALYQKASVREKVLMVGTGLSVVAFAFGFIALGSPLAELGSQSTAISGYGVRHSGTLLKRAHCEVC